MTRITCGCSASRFVPDRMATNGGRCPRCEEQVRIVSEQFEVYRSADGRTGIPGRASADLPIRSPLARASEVQPE
ncbi:MAG: hypothetical protein HY720_16420 [Planctomycetes bacterium]|nr:hypothetical protein [Planctomycetota bacterium]